MRTHNNVCSLNATFTNNRSTTYVNKSISKVISVRLQICTVVWIHRPNKYFFGDCLYDKSGCRCPSTDSSPLEVQLQCQVSAVFLDGRQCRGSSRQSSSWERTHTMPAGQGWRPKLDTMPH